MWRIIPPIKKYWRLALLLIAVILLICYLPLATKLYNRFMLTTQKAHYVSLADEGWDTNLRGNVHVGTLDITSSVTGEDIRVSGWAYIPLTDVPGERVVKIILASDENEYYFDNTHSSLRQDVYTRFSGEGVQLSTDRLGFTTATTSIVGIKDGLYNVGIYVKENDVDYGIMWTEYYIKKEKGITSRYLGERVRVSRPKEQTAAELITDTDDGGYEKNHNIRHAILAVWESTEMNRPYMKIIGFAYQENGNTANQKVYVQITNQNKVERTYLANSYQYTPVAIETGNYDYLNCGFVAYIPINELEWGDIEINILLEENPGEIVSISEPYRYSIGLDTNRIAY